MRNTINSFGGVGDADEIEIAYSNYMQELYRLKNSGREDLDWCKTINIVVCGRLTAVKLKALLLCCAKNRPCFGKNSATVCSYMFKSCKKFIKSYSPLLKLFYWGHYLNVFKTELYSQMEDFQQL